MPLCVDHWKKPGLCAPGGELALPNRNPSCCRAAAGCRRAGINPAPDRRYTGDPISVNLKDVDLKDFFRLIHEISGLNVVLDPSVNGTGTSPAYP